MKGFIKSFVNIFKNPWVIGIYLTVLLIGVSYYLFSQGEAFKRILATSQIQILCLAFISYVLVVGLINPYIYYMTYWKIGAKVSLWQAFRVYHLSRIGNYLPGKVWFPINYYVFSRKINIDSDKIGGSFIVLNALLFFTGSICSLPIISVLNPFVQKLLIILPFMMLAIIHPKILNRILAVFSKKEVYGDYTYRRFYIKIGTLYLVAYFFIGVALYFCLLAFQPIETSNFLVIMSAGASSLVVGLLAIFAPGGLGVREGIAVAVLSQVVPIDIAAAAVIALRLVSVIADLGCALISSISVAREEKTTKRDPILNIRKNRLVPRK